MVHPLLDARTRRTPARHLWGLDATTDPFAYGDVRAFLDTNLVRQHEPLQPPTRRQRWRRFWDTKRLAYPDEPRPTITATVSPLWFEDELRDAYAHGSRAATAEQARERAPEQPHELRDRDHERAAERNVATTAALSAFDDLTPYDIRCPLHPQPIARDRIADGRLCPADYHDWVELDGYDWRECRDCGLADVTCADIGQSVDTPNV
jgi:hypothetical protein